MAGSIKNIGMKPRVFISYSRSDGERFATTLRMRLEAEGIPLWQDRDRMEGGRDWWLQIVEALDNVEFLVLVMTPAALHSPIVRKEWRTARQKGVCVYPVKAHPAIDFASLPRWMRDVHWYEIKHEWKKFVNDLNTRCEQKRVPFMVEDLTADFVERPNEFQKLINTMLDTNRDEPIATTAALHGAGGYGKTTLVKALCQDERIQEAFDDGILWVTLGERPGNIIGKVEDLIYVLSHERPGFTGIDAVTTHFAELLADRDILLVIDDVWNEVSLKPFLQGGKRCARLITTRDEHVLPPNSQCIQVDAMRQSEAVQLLEAGLDSVTRSVDDARALRILAGRLGEWPLLLKLVNGVLRERVIKYQQVLSDAIVYINKALGKRGLTAFDAKNAQERSQATAKTLDVSLELLSLDEIARYKELAIFPEDCDIPLATLQILWGTTGGMDDIDTEDLCEHLHVLSLLLRFDPVIRIIRLHDVVRAYLQQQVGAIELTIIHGRLLDAYGRTHWVGMPYNEPYLWDHLADHLIGAGRIDDLVATVKDGHYLASKIYIRSVHAVEADLVIAEREIPDDRSLSLLRRSIARMSHLLNRCKTLHEAESVLHSRLSHIKELSSVCKTLEQELLRPFLTSWHSLPDLPHPALIRILQGHTNWVRGCAISPTGDYIVSASGDRTLKVWNVQTGAERLTLSGHTSGVNGCTISPTGDYIVSASDDETLKVWDAQTGGHLATLRVDSRLLVCTFFPDGKHIVAGGNGGIYFLQLVR